MSLSSCVCHYISDGHVASKNGHVASVLQIAMLLKFGEFQVIVVG